MPLIMFLDCVSFFVSILSVLFVIDPSNLTNHIHELLKNLIKTSLISQIHFTFLTNYWNYIVFDEIQYF